MASLAVPQQWMAEEYFGEVTVEAGMTASKHRQVLNELGFNETLIEERKKDRRERTDWTEFVMNRLHFSRGASGHFLSPLMPTEVGIDRAADLSTKRDFGADGEDDLFIPSFYKAANAEGFYPCMPDVVSVAGALFMESSLSQLYLAHQPIRDSGGGEMVLKLSRRQSGLWLNEVRWHPTVQHLLSCETPWLFCRAD